MYFVPAKYFYLCILAIHRILGRNGLMPGSLFSASFVASYDCILLIIIAL
jgi:hypothetical protein